MAGLVLGSHGENTSKLSSADRGSTKPNMYGAIHVLIRKHQWTESYGMWLQKACIWKNGLFDLYSPAGDLVKHDILMFRKISSGKMSSLQNVVFSIISVPDDSHIMSVLYGRLLSCEKNFPCSLICIPFLNWPCTQKVSRLTLTPNSLRQELIKLNN